ncbi:substrate-binding domain-containing protein [bacterium]|nr:substrate-binding domain-containing protein [bacterium]
MTTLNEIARLANVSVGTVDRVIHNRGRVSDETRQKVRQIVEELDYHPNVFARNLSLQKTYNFGVLIPSPYQDGKYWELPVSGIMRALDELKMYPLKTTVINYDKYSQESFLDACRSLKKTISGLDGLVIAPVLSEASEKLICELPESLPYVFIDSYVPESHCLAYIGQESYQSGVLAAKLMQLKLDGGKVASLRVHPVDYHLDDRNKGFESILGAEPDFTVISQDVHRDTDVRHFNQVSVELVRAYPDLKGIFVPSACTHQVAEALIELGKSRDVVLIGYDLVEENRKYLKNGTIDFLISQRPALQGYQSIYSLYRHVILKESVEKKVVVPMDILTQENVDYYQG